MVRILESLIKNENIRKLNFSYLNKAKRDCYELDKGIVFFVIGGITYSEISCIRKLAKIYDKEIMILTSNILNSTSIVNEFLEE